MASFGFAKSQRITKRSDFQQVLLKGKKVHTKHFIVACCRTNHDTMRLGITVRKKVGNAVKRNRVKRLIREFFRRNKSLFAVSSDTVIIAKQGAHELNYHQVATELGKYAPFEP
jgi:ribonuclease P protein component